MLHADAHGAYERGAAWRRQPCEHCGGEYFYFNEQLGYGEAASIMFIGSVEAKHAAAREASGDLLFRLKHFGQLVRCPDCGKFQAAMIAQARQELASRALRRGIAWTLLPVFGFAISAMFIKAVEWPMLGMFVSGLLGGVATLSIWYLARSFDPNQDRYLIWRPDKETEQKALTRKAFEFLVAEGAIQDDGPTAL
ncbi:MAG: hypothetical protein HPKKFMNG_01030 [Planctomycetes bacterium]|nr:hypothetical protein [Planctomycetota bacterium]